MPSSQSSPDPSFRKTADALFAANLESVARGVDRMFLWLLLAQWVFAIVLAVSLSPYAWEGKTHAIHLHVQIAVFFGALINALPITLIFVRPGWIGTRYSIAVVQMLWSAVLIHLTGGRIETHFHVFGSLAFLAFYKDWRVLVPATLTIALDHYLRGVFWPESVYGTLNPEWWRFLEHSGWVLFEDVVLVLSCLSAVALYRQLAEREAGLRESHLKVLQHAERLEVEIAERKAQEEEARRARLEAETASRAKSRFLANMSHEIRTPMNGVLGFTNLLMLDAGLSAEQRGHVQTIQQSGESLLHVINDILDFSKVEAGQMSVERVPFDLHQAVEAVTMLLSPQARAMGLALTIECAANLPHRVSGDPGRVRQVLLNLIGNAIKFTQQGSVLIELTTAAPIAGCPVVNCRISDTGIGIPHENQAAMFQEFSQADSSTTRRFGGTGLGLVISKRLIELMGGQIGFSSEAGRGSSFWFTLPVTPAEEGSGRFEALTPGARGAAMQAQVPHLDAADIRVLVAEDNPVNQKLIRHMLEKLGCRVDIAPDGRAALSLAREHEYGLIFMDCSMPEMDGYEATAELRRDPPRGGRRVPIIALTANAMGEDRARCLEAGMHDYLSKPVRLEEVQAALQRWVAGENGVSVVRSKVAAS